MLITLCIFVTLLCQTQSTILKSNPNKNWVVLVAGSNGWWNYRHQSDVCHAYQIVRRYGVPAEQIITFMYDDVANHEKNPFPGKIFNDVGKSINVYEGVQVDYNREDVTPEMFMRVLKGDQTLKEQGKKVLESGPNDNVFIYFSDHGAEGLISFPNDELYASQLNDTLTYLYENNRYDRMAIYVEACHSGSMFDGILSDQIRVYATTAANPSQSSYATFCYDAEINTCLADEYSHHWMTDTETQRLFNRTLDNQYAQVKVATKGSEVMRYGDLTMGDLTLHEFQAHGDNVDYDLGSVHQAESDSELLHAQHRAPSVSAHLTGMTRELHAAKTGEEHESAKKKLHRAIQLGTIVTDTFDEIVKSTKKTGLLFSEPVSKQEQMMCFESVFPVFKNKCFTIQQVPEVAPQVSKLQALCKQGYSAEEITKSIYSACH